MSLKPLAPMQGSSSPHSKVMVVMIPTISHRIHVSVPSQFESIGTILQMTVLFLSHVMEINWSHDGNQLIT